MFGPNHLALDRLRVLLTNIIVIENKIAIVVESPSWSELLSQFHVISGSSRCVEDYFGWFVVNDSVICASSRRRFFGDAVRVMRVIVFVVDRA